MIQSVEVQTALIAGGVAILSILFDRLVFAPRLEAKRLRFDKARAEHAAETQYKFEERKRLLSELGSLRYQLLAASRDLAHSIETYGLDDRRWPIDLSKYYGKSTIFRVLRPFAICEVIEGKTSVADFSVDESAIGLLQFKKSIFQSLCSRGPTVAHPSVNWENEEQHVYFNSIVTMARSLVVLEGEQERVMRFDEFEAAVAQDEFAEKLAPLAGIFKDFALEACSIFWIRLVCYGYLCRSFVNKHGADYGFDSQEYPVEKLIAESRDQHFSGKKFELLRVLDSLKVIKL